MRDRRAGGATLPLLVLLIAAGGAGAYNYQRNVQAEATVPRPYKGYSDAELEALVQAYDDEVTRLDARYLKARQQRAEQRGGQLLDERVDDFERARQVSQKLKGMQAETSGQESILAQLEREMELRTGDRSGWALHWQRLTRL